MNDRSEQVRSDAKKSAGATLHEERRRQNMSVGDVSRHLKLSVRQVEALERDEFGMFGGAVFVHGFLRNYAKLLGIDVLPLIEAADELLGVKEGEKAAAAAHGVMAQSAQDADTHSPASMPAKGIMPVVLVLVIVIAGVTGWMLTRQTDEPESGEPAVTSETIGEPQIQMGRGPENDTPMTEPGAEVQPQQVPAAVVTRESKPRPRPDAPAGVVVMVFRQDSWAEVTDYSGEIVFSRLVPAGSSQRVTAVPPISVVIGNAAGVDLYYNNKEVDLEPYTRVDVARLNLE